MPGSTARTIAKVHGGKTSEALRVPVDALFFDPKFELREDLGDIDWIMETIRRDGYWKKEPIEVRPHKDSQKLEIVDGRRRYRACLQVKDSGNLGKWDGLVEIIPQYDMSDVDLLFKTITSNNDQRKPFNMLEEGSYFNKLNKDFKIEPEEISGRIGKSITYVLDRLALANVDSIMKDEFKSYISNGTLSPTAAAKIAKISDEKERAKVWADIKINHNKVEKVSQDQSPKNGETLINGKKVETVIENGREKVVHPKVVKPKKIKISDVIKGSKKGVQHVSIKILKSNLEKCEKMFEETGSDYWECGVKVLKATLENKVID